MKQIVSNKVAKIAGVLWRGEMVTGDGIYSATTIMTIGLESFGIACKKSTSKISIVEGGTIVLGQYLRTMY